MKSYLPILPIALLVTYSQLVVKWRSNVSAQFYLLNFPQNILRFISDPLILSAYSSALIASLGWLYVVTKLPVTVAFPVYIGITFIMVSLGGYFFLSEKMTVMRCVAVLIILSGIILGILTDG